MYELPSAIKSSIRKYQPIETEGLTLYPILVKDYDLYCFGKPAIDVMQQSLPVRLMSVPLLQAFYAMDYEAVVKGQEPIGLFSRCLLFLGLSLRLGGRDAESIVRKFRFVTDKNDPSRLVSVVFTVNGEEIQRITPVQFSRLRPILAAQNGIEIVSESANPEIVQAEKEAAEGGDVQLSGNIEELISSVAALSGAEESEIDEWPILKLINRQTAWQRIIGYMVCGISVGNGAKYKGGIPYPDIWFNRVKTDSPSLVPMSSIGNGAAMQAASGGK